MNDLIETKIENDSLILSIKQQYLINIAESIPGFKCKILDRDKFIKLVEFSIKNYVTSNSQEIGLSAMEELVQDIVADACEDGDYKIIEVKEEEEEEYD